MNEKVSISEMYRDGEKDLIVQRLLKLK